MLLDKKIEITIFKLDDTTFEPIGQLDEYTSLMWPDAFLGKAMFQLWAPITDSNAEKLKEDNVLWCGGENAAVIKIVKETVNENGEKEFNVKGWTLEFFLIDKIVEGLYNKTGSNYISTIMYDMVDKMAINPSNPNRKIPYLVNAEDKHLGKKTNGYQKTGGNLYDALYDMAFEADIGFSVLFDPYNKRLIFEVRAGVDRTQEQQENDPVLFSTDLEDVLSSTYYLNIEDVKNVAMVQGEEKNGRRTTVYVGDTSLKGFKRKELYVDARDLQSEVYDEDGTSHMLTAEQYNAILAQRGNEKLAEHQKTETFEAQIRQFGDVQYEFGVDYQKGDKITIVDRQLGLSVSARITSVEEDFDDEYALILTFGYSYPTLLQRAKRQLS